MKTRFVFLLLTLLSALLTIAAPVSRVEAYAVAQQFFAGRQMAGCRIKHVTSQPLRQAQCPTDAYYVFNRGEQDGFVIVAGDSRATTTILGYADQGHFDYSTMPANVRWWMEQYRMQLESADAQDLPATAPQTDSVVYTEGQYLLSSTWAQGNPYNLYTPIQNGNHCATGCVATAWSQLLYFHRYPAQGTGSHSYQWGSRTLSTAFSVPYDWDNMQPSYGSQNTDSQRFAVAQLMSDVGIASELYYGESSTGGHEYNSLWAMIHHFGYDPSADLRYRNYYDAVDWDDMLRDNINKGLPLYYGGYSTEGGHAFVCDGYNGDLFHFNWGWGGGYNGFFVSSALHGNYNLNQCAVFNFRPNQGGVYRPQLLLDANPTTSNGNQVFRFGMVRAGLYDSIAFRTRMIMEQLGTDSLRILSEETFSNCSWGDNEWGINPVRNTDSLPAGTYRISVRYRMENDTCWSTFTYRRGKAHYILIQVDSTGRRSLLPYDGPDDSVEFLLDGIKYRLTSQTKKEVEVIRHTYSATSYVIPGYIQRGEDTFTVTAIADSAFMGRTALQYVKIDEGVRQIGKSAFASCARLTDVSLPASLLKIGNNAFTGCTRLMSIRSVAPEPPVLDGSTVFVRSQISQMRLSVPCDLIEAYQQVNIWNKMRLFPADYQLVIQTQGMGEVMLQPLGCDSVLLVAQPDGNYRFTGWSTSQTADTITLVLTADTTVTAAFEPVPSALTSTPSPFTLQHDGNHIVVTSEDATIRLYTVDGRLLTQARGYLSASLPASGIYILRVGNATTKIIAR